ncbi:MAG: NUDIX domain-containing protein [Patescibacteria group bacterium]
MEIIFHLRARAVIIKEGRVLLVRQKGVGHAFLPGGHVELGEQAEKALIRELEEETDIAGTVKSFLGVIENSWVQDDARQQEINLFFEVDVPNLDSSKDPVSKEDHLEFFWSMPGDFEKYVLLPAPLRQLIPAWLNGERKAWWASVFK